ncbi:hypothetical protein BC828DRAFT_407913, partial [Blastocladiella britannica]
LILFEKTTFLVISHVSRFAPETQLDSHRFEKISNIIKQFKLACAKSQAQFSALEVRHKGFSVYLDKLTANTFVMMIVSDPTIQSRAALSNIASARRHFEALEMS